MGSVIRFDEHDLIFVVEIQWSLLIYLDGEMEHGSSYFGCGNEGRVATVHLSYEFCASESILCGSCSGHKDGAVIDCDRDGLFDYVLIPKRGRWH
jgi:hypothetical protein